MNVVTNLIPKGSGQQFSNPEVLYRQYMRLLETMVNKRYAAEEERLDPQTTKDRREELTAMVGGLNESINLITGNFGVQNIVSDRGPDVAPESRTAIQKYEAMSDADLRNAMEQAVENEGDITTRELNALVNVARERGIK